MAVRRQRRARASRNNFTRRQMLNKIHPYSVRTHLRIVHVHPEGRTRMGQFDRDVDRQRKSDQSDCDSRAVAVIQATTVTHCDVVQQRNRRFRRGSVVDGDADDCVWVVRGRALVWSDHHRGNGVCPAVVHFDLYYFFRRCAKQEKKGPC